MTGEHIFSRGVVPGPKVTIEGAPWLPKDSLTIGIESAVANILCGDHNHQLGAEVDHVAKGLREAIAESVRNRPASIGSATAWITTGGGVLTPRPQLRVSGKAYARWLCKTHCNVMVTAGHTPALDYVRDAFDKTPRAHLYFYYPHVLGETVPFTDRAHATYMNFHDEGEPFAIDICGFWTLVAMKPVLGDGFVDRVREINFATLQLLFDWRDDPPLGQTL